MHAQDLTSRIKAARHQKKEILHSTWSGAVPPTGTSYGQPSPLRQVTSHASDHERERSLARAHAWTHALGGMSTRRARMYML